MACVDVATPAAEGVVAASAEVPTKSPVASAGSGALNGLLSRGSAGHPDGCGLPCKYHWKPRGCKDGAACARCHLCPWQPLLARGAGGAAGPRASKALKNGTKTPSDAAAIKDKDPVVGKELAVRTSPKAKSSASQTRDERLFANALRWKDVPDAELELKVPRLEDGSPSSIGTFLHESKQCIRCIYVFTRQGCPNGIRCKFCHANHPVRQESRGQKRQAEDREASSERSPKQRIVVCNEFGNSRPSWLQEEDDEPPVAGRYGAVGSGWAYPAPSQHPQPAWGVPPPHWPPAWAAMPPSWCPPPTRHGYPSQSPAYGYHSAPQGPYWPPPP